jgi:hypothetical protein
MVRAGVGGRPRKQGQACSTHLAGADQEKVAPPAGGRRSFIDGGTYGGDGRQQGEKGKPGSKEGREDVQEVRGLTLELKVSTSWPEEEGVHHNLKKTSTAGVGEGGPRRRCGASRLDSSGEDDEDVEADLLVVVAGRGEAGVAGTEDLLSGGHGVQGILPLFLAVGRRKKKEAAAGGGEGRL